MDKIKITDEDDNKDKTIMIFAEGTVLKPKSWLHLYFHNAYIPIGSAQNLIKSWQLQGARIIYCTSRRGEKAKQMAEVLKRYSFPGNLLVSREKGEKYKDIVEQIHPDILIEDDCRSIGGSWQMCITKVRLDIKKDIISIVVPEFEGISHLPVKLNDLINK